MELLNLDNLGAREIRPGLLDFGLLLPGISPDDGYALSVRIIHQHDQFLQDIPPSDFHMSHGMDPVYGDYWSTKVPVDTRDKPTKKSAWGLAGRYVYRYVLKNSRKKIDLDWIIDPFAREFGTGKLSAITVGYKPYAWSDAENDWKTPALEDLVVYELMISEFGGSIDEAVLRLDYLADLGITCIEVMPVSNTANTVDWGYMPTGYFGVDERFGKRKDFQSFVDNAHQQGIAVILDAVYGHTDECFPYAYVYDAVSPGSENPFIGLTAASYVGKSTNFHKKFTRDFFFTANMFWLDRFHVDGFRYDCVSEYYDGPEGDGYANLVYNTYRATNAAMASGGHWQRFFRGDEFNLIQCAEKPESPGEFLEKTYSNTAWQSATLNAAENVARGHPENLTGLGHSLGLICCPEVITCNTDTLKKTAFQYIENHDSSRFICNFGMTRDPDELMREGDRSLCDRVRPYLIGLILAKGIPLLWQGQEFGENYSVPAPFTGRGRVHIFRPMRWDYFYTAEGKSLVCLVRKLLQIRKGNARFRHGEHYFYNHHDNYQSKNVLLFSRSDHDAFSLIALNFSDHEQKVWFTFPHSGNYQEEIHGEATLSVVVADQSHELIIPRHDGRVWSTAIR